MDERLLVMAGVAVVAVCSIAFVASLPALAMAAVRMNVRGCGRIAAGMSVLTGVALVVSFGVGSSPSAYSILP